MAGPGPTMSTSDSSNVMSITWPFPVWSRCRSAASTANAPRMPVTSSASAIGGSVGGPLRAVARAGARDLDHGGGEVGQMAAGGRPGEDRRQVEYHQPRQGAVAVSAQGEILPWGAR